MSRWREVVREELARYRAQTELAVVSRQELLDQSLPRLEAEFPDNNTHEQSLSRTLQELRDCGEIGFLSEGTYRILSLDADSDAATDAAARSGVEVTYTASEYETTATGRRIHPEFRETVLRRFGERCPVSGVDHAGLLDVAHVLPWSDHPDRRADFGNVLALSKTHHAAFDRELFTLDSTYRLRVNPAFETSEAQRASSASGETVSGDVLARTLVERNGERVRLPQEARPSPTYLETRNESLDWSPA